MDTRNIKAILFDVDETLFDRDTAQYLVLDVIVKRLPGIFSGIDMENITRAFLESDAITTTEFNEGAPSEGLRDRRSCLFLNALDLPEDYAPLITNMYVSEYPKVKAAVPGAITTVRKLAKSYKLGVVSKDVQYQKLETLGLRSFFSCIVLSDEVGVRKPDPGIFIFATSHLQLEPLECLYVGDSYSHDVIGARKVGMQVCWYNPKNKKPANHSTQPDFIINSLEELTGICVP